MIFSTMVDWTDLGLVSNKQQKTEFWKKNRVPLNEISHCNILDLMGPKVE